MIQIAPQMRILVATEPVDFRRGIDGLAALSRNGLRYPIPNHGIQKSPVDSIETS